MAAKTETRLGHADLRTMRKYYACPPEDSRLGGRDESDGRPAAVDVMERLTS